MHIPKRHRNDHRQELPAEPTHTPHHQKTTQQATTSIDNNRRIKHISRNTNQHTPGKYSVIKRLGNSTIFEIS